MRWQDFAWFANSERIYPPLIVWNFAYLFLIAIFDALPVELSDPEWTELQSCRRQREFEAVVANRSVCFCGEIYERREIQNLAPPGNFDELSCYALCTSLRIIPELVIFSSCLSH